ncbi:dUTP diphosphatase [Halalkalibacter alkaliphilus]|uniref:dUTP diphosphatase n=1 Tax=Halalkalibacter alkaliphilus TaxID=2917993 RepID=A0A9X2CWV1_9BACI|nr:dUTP diphosphatase [Halalkalibacter alkaliphilus]MCL7749805.1 dUTP diphosphatase [Halalkalibacter alkaliphilus]
MEIEKLFAIQKELNDRIVQEHHLMDRDLFKEQLLAFVVEIAELANETRCFKYWSLKLSSERSVILEEYVDGLHFILTLGLTLNFTSVTVKEYNQQRPSVTDQFLFIMNQAHELDADRTQEKFQQLVDGFFTLGQQLGFSNEEIEKAYLVKNRVNHERQDSGY